MYIVKNHQQLSENNELLKLKDMELVTKDHDATVLRDEKHVNQTKKKKNGS